jgi:RHS repeat-associated protein
MGVCHVERTGTTSVVLDADGSLHSEARHYPYGEERWRSPVDGTLPTDYRFTGQRDTPYIKLYHMGARFYDFYLGRFLSPDTIIPEPTNPQSFNRYSYVNNRPLVAIDPSGHDLVLVGGAAGDTGIDAINRHWKKWIMEYKGWNKEQWLDFYNNELLAPNNTLSDLMHINDALHNHGIHLFTWGGHCCISK